MADVEKELLLRIRADSNLGPQLSQDADALQQLGNKMSEATEQVHKFRSGVDDTVEQLNIFGDRGSALVGEINKISSPLKRLELANKALASSSFQSGGALGQLGGKFQEAKVKAAIAVGGVENLTLALGGAGVALGGVLAGFGFLASATQKYIESNKEATRRTNEVKSAFDDFVVSIGQVVFETPAFQAFMDLAIRKFKDLKDEISGVNLQQELFIQGQIRSQTYKDNADKRAGFRSGVFGEGGPATDPILDFDKLQKNIDYSNKFKDQLDSQQEQQEQIKRNQENLRKGIDKLLSDENKLKIAVTKNIETRGQLEAIQRDLLQKQFKNETDRKKILEYRALGLITEEQLIAKEKELSKKKGKGSGGGGPKRQDTVAISFSDAATNTLKEIFDNLAIKIGGQISATPLALQGAQATAGAIQDTRGQQLGSALAAAQGGVGKGLDTGLSTATEQAKAFDDQVNNLKGSFLDLGVGITDAFLAFSVGATTGKQALAGVLSNIGSLAAQLGTFFILLGTAEGSTGFLGLKGGAAIASGSALLAFGAGLKAGGAYLGKDEKKEKKAKKTKAPDLNRGLGQVRDNLPPLYLVIEGDRMVEVLRPSFERSSRLNRFNLQLGR